MASSVIDEKTIVPWNSPGSPGRRNDMWHCDLSFTPCPPAVSLLYALQVQFVAGRLDKPRRIASRDGRRAAVQLMMLGQMYCAGLFTAAGFLFRSVLSRLVYRALSV